MSTFVIMQLTCLRVGTVAFLANFVRGLLAICLNWWTSGNIQRSKSCLQQNPVQTWAVVAWVNAEHHIYVGLSVYQLRGTNIPISSSAQRHHHIGLSFCRLGGTNTPIVFQLYRLEGAFIHMGLSLYWLRAPIYYLC